MTAAINRLTVEIEFPVVHRMRNCFDNYFRCLNSLISIAKLRHLNRVESASVKYRLHVVKG